MTADPPAVWTVRVPLAPVAYPHTLNGYAWVCECGAVGPGRYDAEGKAVYAAGLLANAGFHNTTCPLYLRAWRDGLV
jgi:hypothetical protein